MPLDPTAASENLRVAILGAVAPYREGIASALRESGFEPVSENNRERWLEDRQRRGLIALIGGGFRWFDVEAFTCLTEVTTIALVPEIRVDHYMKALRLGCHGVVHFDTSAQIIVSVFEAALRGEVVLPREAARVMANGTLNPTLSSADLDDTELRIMSRLATGETVVNLATDSGWSERTVRRTLHSIYIKLGAANRAEAIAKASKLGLLE